MRLTAGFAFIPGLFVLLLAGICFATDHQGFAQRLLILVFYIFLLGTAKYLSEIRRDE